MEISASVNERWHVSFCFLLQCSALTGIFIFQFTHFYLKFILNPYKLFLRDVVYVTAWYVLIFVYSSYVQKPTLFFAFAKKALTLDLTILLSLFGAVLFRTFSALALCPAFILCFVISTLPSDVVTLVRRIEGTLFKFIAFTDPSWPSAIFIDAVAGIDVCLGV
mmetsp:Transcript_47634/g.72032  ORF Transcript_47634/g.72032 Transcript_47634/m.72032 type:complete len:164 (+) Transcript_47634:249-740(+)